MFFDIVKCSSCHSNMRPDFEASILAYMNNEFKNESNLVLQLEDAPIVPDYLMLKCENRNCNCESKTTYKEFFDNLIKFWSNIAFQRSQLEARSNFQFEQYATKYLIDEVTGKALTKKDIEGNPIIRDLMTYMEKLK